MVHKHIKKHVKKHEKKYARFSLFFAVLVLFSAVEDVIAVLILKSETFLEVVLVAVGLSFVFTLIGEEFEKFWKYEKKKLKK